MRPLYCALDRPPRGDSADPHACHQTEPMRVSEQVLYQAHPPMFRNKPLGFILSIVLVPAVVGIVILLVWYVKRNTETLTITGDILSYEQGFLSKSRSEVRLTSIRSVRVSQRLLQRLFDTGDVDVYTAGDAPEISARGMPNPNKVRELIDAHS